MLVSVKREGEAFRISLDDAIREVESDRSWIQSEHVTNKPFAVDAFEKMEFDEKELANFGYYILARLSAFVKRSEN